MRSRTLRFTLLAVLLAGMALHTAYLLAQPAHDPGWDRPVLDGEYYLAWARALAGASHTPAGSFYLAPLYPYLLAGFIRIFGDHLLLVFVAQQAAVVGAAALLGAVARRHAGDVAAIATAALVLLYHPPMFFAARPVGESLAVLLLAGSIFAAGRHGPRMALLAGGLAASSALARPNLLLVPMIWIVILLFSRRWSRALLVATAVSAVLAPVTLRNLRASGHAVPVSSNGGITFFQGNGPGATGIFTPPRGLSGRIDTQRDEATALARLASGKDLDPVQADGWWAQQAIRARLDDPLGSFRLLAWRTWLFFDNYEHGLDYPPALDGNPWRTCAPVPFAVLLGLAAAGFVLAGVRRTGGMATWGALTACAATPVLFYAASRYRLPAGVLLCVPAGAAFEALFARSAPAVSSRRLAAAVGSAIGVAVISLTVPSASLASSAEAGAFANFAELLQRSGDLVGAERAARAGIARDPEGLAPRFQLGWLLEKQGRRQEAERAYHGALAIDAGHAPSAGNLARLLIERSAPAEAVPVLEEALRANPIHEVCWNNLVVALALTGDRKGAADAWYEAKRRGVAVDEDLLQVIAGGPHASPEVREENR